MGISIRKILEIITIPRGANKQLLEQEVRENQLLGQILRQQQITNAVLLKILEHDDPDLFTELMEELS